MKIINPLYDTAFKYLMDNEPIAKIVLSILLDQNVISIQSKPQETPVTIDGIQYVKRYDFKAIVQSENNETSTILLEVQKYKYPNPISRFRHYLGENYIKQETIINSKGKTETVSLPIQTIYILGFKVTKEEVLVIKVENKAIDYLNKVALKERCEFIEKLTHSSLIIQTTAKVKDTKNTRLEKFIHLFSQKLENEESNYIIEIEDDENDEQLKQIKSHLNKATLESDILRSMRYEKEYDESMQSLEIQLEEAKIREEEERRQKEEERRQKEEAKQKLINSLLKFYKKGFSIKELVEDFNMSEKEIAKIIENNETK